MGEHIQNYAARNFYQLDRNQNRIIEMGDPFGLSRPETGGRTYNWLRTASQVPIIGAFAIDQYSFTNAIYRDVDMNHDQQIGFIEKCLGFIKYGLW